jgi:hypothetical protein
MYVRATSSLSRHTCSLLTAMTAGSARHSGWRIGWLPGDSVGVGVAGGKARLAADKDDFRLAFLVEDVQRSIAGMAVEEHVDAHPAHAQSFEP